MRPHVVILVALVAAAAVVAAKFDPYYVLGVRRGATTPEIRKQYKKLAKEWHPDKNKAENAQERFIEITKSYELLNDDERRQRYDSHGITENNEHPRTGGGYNRGGDPFESFVSNTLALVIK
jgi:DnaJ-class molecular chaperone